MFDNTKLPIPILNTAILEKLVWIKNESYPGNRNRQFYSFNELLISQDNRGAQINGSLHKAYNLRFNSLTDANYTDFTAGEMLKIVEFLCTELELNPFTTPVINPEFGVNISTPIKAKKILQNVLYLDTSEQPEPGIAHCLSLTTNAQHFRLKVYDKGIQQQQGEYYNLRVELHPERMQFLLNENIHIRVLADLFCPAIHKTLGDLLIRKFDELVFSPQLFELPQFRKENRRIIQLFNDREQLENLRIENRRKYKNDLEKYRELIKLSPEINIHQQLKNSILDKWHTLTNLDENVCRNLTRFLSKYPQFYDNKFNNLYKVLSPYLENIHQLPPVNIKRVCASCGKDISHQKPGSTFCGENLVGYTEAHKCRNDFYNPIHNLKKAINKRNKYLGLFSLEATIKPEILRRARMA